MPNTDTKITYETFIVNRRRKYLNKLIKINDSVMVLNLPTNIGFIIENRNNCIVIDTGFDEDYGRKILRILSELRCNNIMIINTHSHADHTGGNSFLYSRTRAKIYSHPKETCFIKYPELLPAILYGGAPPSRLRTKLLYPKPVNEVYDVFSIQEEISVEIIGLSGHSPGMIGLAHEDVLFSADTFFNTKIINKYKIPFHLDVQSAMNSLEKLRKKIFEGKYNYIVPSHGKILDPEKAVKVMEENINVIKSIRRDIISTVSEYKEIEFDRLVNHLFKKYNLRIRSVEEYYLLSTSIKSFLKWIIDDNIADMVLEDNKLKFRIR